MAMIAIIEGVEFEVENRAEALSSAPGLGAMDVTVLYWHPIRKKVREEHYRLVDGQWFGYAKSIGEWVGVDTDGRVNREAWSKLVRALALVVPDVR